MEEKFVRGKLLCREPHKRDIQCIDSCKQRECLITRMNLCAVLHENGVLKKQCIICRARYNVSKGRSDRRFVNFLVACYATLHPALSVGHTLTLYFFMFFILIASASATASATASAYMLW